MTLFEEIQKTIEELRASFIANPLTVSTLQLSKLYRHSDIITDNNNYMVFKAEAKEISTTTNGNNLVLKINIDIYQSNQILADNFANELRKRLYHFTFTQTHNKFSKVEVEYRENELSQNLFISSVVGHIYLTETL